MITVVNNYMNEEQITKIQLAQLKSRIRKSTKSVIIKYRWAKAMEFEEGFQTYLIDLGPKILSKWINEIETICEDNHIQYLENMIKEQFQLAWKELGTTPSWYRCRK